MSSSSLAKVDDKKYKTPMKEITCVHVVEGRSELKMPETGMRSVGKP